MANSFTAGGVSGSRPFFRARLQKCNLAFGRQRQPRAAVIDERDEEVSAAKAQGTMTDGFDLVFIPLTAPLESRILVPARRGPAASSSAQARKAVPFDRWSDSTDSSAAASAYP